MTDFTLPDDTVVHLIGDPHLGRKFEVGVPLARRGEREASQLAHFKRELAVECDLNIMVGDLFDHPYVGYWTAQEVSQAVETAVRARPQTTFVMQAGNHDMPRNITAVGAFDDFRDRLRDRFHNLHILNKPQIVEGVACFPWEWDRRADQQVLDLKGRTASAAVGHWDLSSFGGKDNHLAPVDALRKAFGDIPLYSGHYHIAGWYLDAVTCTGSLEPYTHAEDPSQTLYITLSREEALAHGSLVDKNVRIRLKPGEEMPTIDCLSLTYIREKAAIDDGFVEKADVTRDWNKLLEQKLAPLDERVRGFIKDRMSVSTTEE